MEIPPSDITADAPDAVPLIRVLRRIEAEAEAAGWSENGYLCVWVIYDHHDVVTEGQYGHMLAAAGAPLRTSRYTARPMVPAQYFTSTPEVSPQVGLRNYAMNLAYTDPAALGDMADLMVMMRHMLAMPGIVAFAASYEAWFEKRVSEGQLRRALAGQSRFADSPSAQEVRIVLGVDRADRVHKVSRIRHQAAEVEAHAPIRGDISTSLRILMDTACGRLPDRAGFAERYPTLIEARRRAGRDL